MGRAPGGDCFMAEYLKFGGPLVHAQLHTIVSITWRSAQTADPGTEVAQWPTAWTKGVVFPLSKRGQASQEDVARDHSTFGRL